MSIALIEGDRTVESFEKDRIDTLIDKLKSLGIQDNLLVLWQNKNTERGVEGFFYSTSEDSTKRVADFCKSKNKNGLVLLSIANSEINSEKDKIINLLKEKKTNISIYAESLK